MEEDKEETATIYYCKQCDDLVEIEDREEDCPSCKCPDYLQSIG